MATEYQNIPNNSWGPPVDTYADLPIPGNPDGEVRVTKDSNAIYEWDLSANMWVLMAAAGAGGISSLNGQTGSTQTFATGTSGTDFNISSSGDIHTFNLPFADGTNTGKLSNTDWTTFNDKLTSTLANGKIFIGNVSNIATAQTPTGDVTITNSGVTAITAGVIVNADINSAAAIAYSKLNLSNSIVNADINASAAIVYSKLALTDSIVNADISSTAAIAYSKLSLTNSIVNTDINASAAIAYSKLNLSNSIVNADINASAAIAYSKLNLALSIVNSDIGTTAAIAYSKLNLVDSIKNADISSVAAIDASKIANGSVSSTEFQYLDGVTSAIQTQLDAKLTSTLANGAIFIGNVSNLATAQTPTGDVTISNTGVTSITADVIVNADVNSNAAIAYSKLNLTGSIVNADIGTAAAIAYSKLNLSNSIVNADINASAAIAYSKLNLALSIVNADIGTAAAIAYSKLALTDSIKNADISSVAAIAYSKLSLSNSIVNADINASAAIAYSKLNLSLSIVNADIGTAAAIAYSKLALSNSIVNADINTSAAIAYSKLALTGSIVNADISTSAAIAYSKLNLALSIVNADIGTAAAIAYSKLNLTASIVNADIGTAAAIAGTKISPDWGSQNTTTTGTSTAASFKAAGTGGAGFYEVVNQSSAPATPTSATRIFADASNRISWKGTNGFVRTLDGTANTADRIYTLEDEAGKLKLKETTQSVSGNVTLTSGIADLICYVSTAAARNVTLPAASANSGRRITLKDITGSGETNNMTLIPNGTDKIEGLNSNKVVSANYFSLTIISDATDWWLV